MYLYNLFVSDISHAEFRWRRLRHTGHSHASAAAAAASATSAAWFDASVRPAAGMFVFLVCWMLTSIDLHYVYIYIRNVLDLKSSTIESLKVYFLIEICYLFFYRNFRFFLKSCIVFHYWFIDSFFVFSNLC